MIYLAFILFIEFLLRLHIIWISVGVTVLMSVLAKFHLFEYQILCIGSYGGPHENFLDTCPEGQKAYVTYSDMRAAPGYRTFVVVQTLVTDELLPFTLIPLLAWRLYRGGQAVSDERTRRTMVATGAMLVMATSQLVHVCYELHSLTMEHSTWVSREYSSTQMSL